MEVAVGGGVRVEVALGMRVTLGSTLMVGVGDAAAPEQLVTSKTDRMINVIAFEFMRNIPLQSWAKTPNEVVLFYNESRPQYGRFVYIMILH